MKNKVNDKKMEQLVEVAKDAMDYKALEFAKEAIGVVDDWGYDGYDSVDDLIEDVKTWFEHYSGIGDGSIDYVEDEVIEEIKSKLEELEA